MKFLIWLSCFFVTALIQGLFGMKLGAIPAVMFFVATLILAKNFSSRYDHRKNKDGYNYKEASVGVKIGFVWYGCSILYVILGTILNSSDPASFDFGTQLIIAIVCILLAVLGHLFIKKLNIVEDIPQDNKAVNTANDTSNEKELISELNNPKITDKAVMDSLIKYQSKTVVDTMKLNAKFQLDNESDDDFGLDRTKPIYTHALKSVDGEIEYLDKLRTEDGQKIKYNRRGSTSVEGVKGIIDIYDIYLTSGEHYKTIYINMYGAKDSRSAPKGFKLVSDLEISKSTKKTEGYVTRAQINTKIKTENSKKIKLKDFINNHKKVWSLIFIISIILTVFFAIGYNTSDEVMSDAYRHYDNSIRFSSYFSKTTIGCGDNDCWYCQGQNILLSYYDGPYSFYQYSHISDVNFVFETLMIFSIIVLIISFVLVAYIGLKKRDTDKKDLRHYWSIVVTNKGSLLYSFIAEIIILIIFAIINSSTDSELMYEYSLRLVILFSVILMLHFILIGILYLPSIINYLKNKNYTNKSKSSNEAFDQIKEARKLLDDGLISKEEFEDIKKKIISKM